MRLTIIAFFALLFGMNTAIADGHDKANAFGFALNVPAEHIAEVEAVLASHMKASTGWERPAENAGDDDEIRCWRRLSGFPYAKHEPLTSSEFRPDRACVPVWS